MSDDSTDEPEEDTTEQPEEDTTEATEGAAVGVKLGSTRTVLKTDDTVDKMLTCLATYEDALTGEERILYGEEAAREYPDTVRYMLRSGLPEDDENAEAAAKFFQAVVEANDVPEASGVVYAVPTMENEAGIRNLESVIESAAIGDIFTRAYPESLCGAVPVFGGVEALDEIFLSINLGSTNLEACAFRRGEALTPYATGGVTGSEVDRRIVSYIEEETQGRVNVDLTTAREYKEEHADFDAFEPFTDVIQQPGGGAHEFTIEDSVMDACDEYLDEVVDAVANEFLPELANDYMKVYQIALDETIVLTGGMACIPGLVDEFERRLSDELQRDIEADAADRPDLAAAEGAHEIAGQLLKHQS